MSLTGLSSLTNLQPRALDGSVRKTDDPSRVEKAASEFESLLIAQLLQSMRTESGWLGTGEDASSSSLIELAEQQLASAMSAQGGLGLAKLVAQGLHQPADQARPEAPVSKLR
jgi:Rod binding domain-containing protein